MAAVIIFFIVFSFSWGYLPQVCYAAQAFGDHSPRSWARASFSAALKSCLIAIGQVVGVLEGIAVGDHVQVEQAPRGGPDVGQRATVLVDGVLDGSVSRYTDWPPRMVLACAEASKPKHCTGFRGSTVSGVSRPIMRILRRLTVGVHMDGVAVDNLDHRERSLNPLRHRRIRLGGAGQDKPGQHHHDRDNQTADTHDAISGQTCGVHGVGSSSAQPGCGSGSRSIPRRYKR